MFVWLSTALASSSTCPVGRGDFVAVGEHSYSPGLFSPLAPTAFYADCTRILTVASAAVCSCGRRHAAATARTCLCQAKDMCLC